ncbi:MAG: PEP-CTERM sorting domain-containing protein [Proteobacteria bacterium]|nr:PEP-CTERM sorting domain-containing protein [Pseudomonadota bacterium]
MKKTTIFKFLAACAVLSSEASYAQMSLLSNFSANYGSGTSAGEIAGFDKLSKNLFVTSSSSAAYQINIFDLSNPSSSVGVGAIDFSLSFGSKANMSALSSVAINSAKGFGVASLIPTANTTTLGKVGFFDLASRTSLGTIDVGYHPDSVSFSPDGSKLIVVNEGEFNASSATNAPGSISVIDVSSITNGNLANLVSLTPVTKDFSSGNLASGVSLSGIRNSNVAAVGTSGTFISSVPDFTQGANQDPNAIEPEYASVIGDKVYVSLQDNNAIGEYDLTQNLWTKVTNLGTITQTIDATDTGSTISITQAVKGLPMPDTLATYSKNGKTYVVTANEGDARVDDRDISRFGDIAGSDSMNTILDSNYPTSNNSTRADTQLGKLYVSRIDGDTDGNGKIDEIRMIGTRSFTIWEVTDAGLQLTYDSGSYFETYIRDNDPTGWVDGRSDDKGPEPEGLTLGEIDGKTFAFIGMERNNGIFMFDITDPNAPSFFGYTRTSDGSLRPEGMSFISAADSPNGQNLLIVGYEGDGATTSERIGVYSVVPEPQTYLLMGIGAAFLLWRARRRAC